MAMRPYDHFISSPWVYRSGAYFLRYHVPTQGGER
jgi:hypothetical protein